MTYEVRLFFEPKDGICVNHTDMFRHYVLNWLSDFDVDFGGYIAMNALDKKIDSLEPVYQVIMHEPSVEEYDGLADYVENNPLIGYEVHWYERTTSNENSRKIA